MATPGCWSFRPATSSQRPLLGEKLSLYWALKFESSKHVSIIFRRAAKGMSALEIFIAIIGNVVAAEIYQNLPALALWMVRRAADRLPPEQRASVGQAWIEDQTKIAGYLARIGHALECWRKTLRDEFARRKVIESAFERTRIRTFLVASYAPFVLATLAVVLLLVSSFYSIWQGISTFTGGAGAYAQAVSFLIALGISACFTIFSFMIAEMPFGLGRWRGTKSRPFRLRIKRALHQAQISLGFTVVLSYRCSSLT
jgi:hypothetical protein